MKKQLILGSILAVILCGCATTNTAKLTWTGDVGKKTYADQTLFRDVLAGKGGIGYADYVLFPDAKEKKLTNIEVIVPYDNHKTGIERWTIEHDGQGSCSYIVKFIPDGNGGATFTVQKDNVSKP